MEEGSLMSMILWSGGTAIWFLIVATLMLYAALYYNKVLQANQRTSRFQAAIDVFFLGLFLLNFVFFSFAAVTKAWDTYKLILTKPQIAPLDDTDAEQQPPPPNPQN